MLPAMARTTQMINFSKLLVLVRLRLRIIVSIIMFVLSFMMGAGKQSLHFIPFHARLMYVYGINAHG